MATKRPRGAGWEFTVRRAKLLDKPLYLTFENEADGDAYCEQLERLLDQGIIPEAVKERTKARELHTTLAVAIRDYRSTTAVSDADDPILNQHVSNMGALDVRLLNHEWADNWITSLKREKQLSPSTIRHHVGALARALDHAKRKGWTVNNPLRDLRKGYATYSDDDGIAAGGKRVEKKREERMPDHLESTVMKYLDQDIKESEDLRSFFIVALASGMRLSELHTLRVDNVHLTKRQVRLIKTKNGTTREVPISKVAISSLRKQIKTADTFVWPWYAEKLAVLELRRPGNIDNAKQAKTQTTNMLSTRWARIFAACGAPGYTIHWIRHEAASRIFEGTDMPERLIMKMFGWKSWEMVDRYSHLRASTIADYLD